MPMTTPSYNALQTALLGGKKKNKKGGAPKKHGKPTDTVSTRTESSKGKKKRDTIPKNLRRLGL